MTKTKLTQVIRLSLSEEMKVVLTSCLLLFIPLSGLMFNMVDPDSRYCFPFLEDGEKYWYISLNPQIHGAKSLQWVVSLGTDRLSAIIYIVCASIGPNFSRFRLNMWAVYGVFESCRLLDHFLTYEQTPFREYFGYMMVVFQILYAVLFLSRKE